MSDRTPEHVPAPADDRVRDTLTALRTDADRVRLVDPTSVRRRGQARTRHQAIAGLAAAVVVVGAVVAGGSLLGGGNEAQVVVPATHSPTAAPTHQLATDPFVQPADIGAVGPQGQWQRSPDAVDYQPKVECMTGPNGWQAAETRSAQYFSDLDATFYEHALRYADADAATAGVQRVLDDFAGCLDQGKPAHTTVRPATPVAGVADAAHASWASDAGPELYYYELGVARVDNVVVVLEWSSMGSPLPDSDWVWTADRLQHATDRAIAD